jgi:hypothetical protein
MSWIHTGQKSTGAVARPLYCCSWAEYPALVASSVASSIACDCHFTADSKSPASAHAAASIVIGAGSFQFVSSQALVADSTAFLPSLDLAEIPAHPSLPQPARLAVSHAAVRRDMVRSSSMR